MLSDSLDPDQDLQSGSKLFTWYDVLKAGRGDYVPVVKFMGEILSTYTKMSGGDFVGGGDIVRIPVK